MWNRRILIVVSVVLLAVMAVPSWGAKFKKKTISDQQFVEMCEKGDTQRVIESIKIDSRICL